MYFNKDVPFNDINDTVKVSILKSFGHSILQLEGLKNKISNQLSGNLMRKREQLVMELQEISVEDRKQKLENSTRELQSLETAVETNRARLEGKNIRFA